MASLEVIVGIAVSGQPLTLSAPESWNQPRSFTYEILNPAGDAVGTSVCTLSPEEDTFLLDCETDVEGFEVNLEHSYWSVIAFQRSSSSRWNKNDLSLKSFEQHSTNELGDLDSSMTFSDEGWQVSVYDEYSNQTQGMEGSGEALMIHQMPWQLMGMHLQTGQNYKADIVWDLRYNEKSGQSEPGLESMLNPHRKHRSYGNRCRQLCLPLCQYREWNKSMVCHK